MGCCPLSNHCCPYHQSPHAAEVASAETHCSGLWRGGWREVCPLAAMLPATPPPVLLRQLLERFLSIHHCRPKWKIHYLDLWLGGGRRREVSPPAGCTPARRPCCSAPCRPPHATAVASSSPSHQLPLTQVGNSLLRSVAAGSERSPCRVPVQESTGWSAGLQ